MEALSAKERRFVAEYLTDQNGTAAAKRAGYSEKSARTIAARMLAKDNIATAVGKGLKRIEEKSDLTAARVRASVLKLLEFDPRKVFNADGTVKPMEQLGDDVIQSVVAVDVDESAGEIKRLRFTDRVRVLELAAKILGMMKFEISGKGGAPFLPATPQIDFTEWTKEEILRAAGMRHGNGNAH
jgi:phage terminase small subunit